MKGVYVAICMPTGQKILKEQYTEPIYCDILRKMAKCSDCGRSQKLHDIG